MGPVAFLLVLLVGSVTVTQVAAASPPLWRLDISRNEPVRSSLGPRMAHDEARVFYLQAGQVKAVDAGTGNPLWTVRVGSGAQLNYSSGTLLAIAARGETYALEPATGRVRWTRTGNAFGIDASNGENLYIAEAGKLSTVKLKMGKTQWVTKTPFASSTKTFTVVKNRVFAPKFVADTYSDQIEIYSAKTGKRLGEMSRPPLAILNNRVFSQDNWFLIDYPDEIYLNVYSLQTGKRLERRTYTVENRVTGQNWTSKIAIDLKAIYISGGSNLACFLLDSPTRKGKPDVIRVPHGDVAWVAGPHRGTFVLEWQESVWLVRQHRGKPCSPVNLLEQGQKLASGRVANVTFAKNRAYIGLKNGAFYVVDTQAGKPVLRLELPTSAFGPTRVVGDRLIIQAGDELRAFGLP